MTKQEMLDQLNSVTQQLEHADSARPSEHESRIAIGALIIAIDHLREIVQVLVEKEVIA